MNGFLLVDKEEGITSLHALEEIKGILDARKAGHAGTLDPLATGLLIVAIGKATRLIEFFEELDKEYLLTIRFGILTDTLDTEGQIISEDENFALDEAKLKETIEKFKGDISQVVPEYSAIKIKGVAAYKMARQGRTVNPPTRKVTIHAIQLEEIAPPNVTLKVSCSKGTYMRALARDIAKVMGTIGIAYSIRRTRIGSYDVKDAIKVRETDDLEDCVISPEQMLSFMPEIRLDEDQEYRFVNGGIIELKPSATFMRVFGPDGFVGIGEAQGETHIKPYKVLSGE